MQRAPIVLAGTVAGVLGVLAYNTASSPSVVAGSASSPTTAQGAVTQTTAATTTHTTSTTAKTSSSRKAVKTASSKARTATGQDVSFQYGDVEVKVTKSGSKITNVSIVRFDISDQHSQQIDEVAVPQLRQEALAAQSAKIDGVSGASYTSAAYEQSLQSALDKLA